jgi:hypothetical protein
MKRKWMTLALLLVCLAAGLAFWPGNSSKQVLGDGTVLVLSGAAIGQTNIYTHGTFLSKTIGRFAPSNGVTVAGYKLQRPESVALTGSDGCEILSAQIHLLPGSPREGAFFAAPFHRRYRLLISGDNGVTFVKEFGGFKKEPDGLFSYIRAESFPRDSRRLHFRWEERDKPQGRDWREVATFVVKNPKPAPTESWKIEDSPRIKLSDGVEAQIGQLSISPEPIHRDDIWETTALLPVRVMDHGQIRANWGVHYGPMWDASGNHEAFTFGKVVTNDWMVYKIFRPLDPTKPWRFQVNFALDSDFPETNLFSFTVLCPMTGAMQTNLGGFPVKIDYAHQDFLEVELLTHPPDVRLSFVSAVDETGTQIQSAGGSWGQHNFWNYLRLSTPVQVHVTVAISKNYGAEFILQPHYDTNHAAVRHE